MEEIEETQLNNKWPRETCGRQLMASMMLETLNTANHDLTVQTEHTWCFYVFV